METEPYITTIEDLDKFLEEMETEVTPPVTPKKSVAFWVTNPCRITRKVEQTKDVRMYT